jgi:hypothetical protein
MKVYQRMLYVGLGGTGLRIGSQLEQVLRLELCGADGRALLAAGNDLEPWELPSFLQFVYADFDVAERKAVSGSSERRASALAAKNTASIIEGLSPSADSYAKVADNLRKACSPVVQQWLPGHSNEPQVAPLSDGAGQLPTVGRAAFFETLRTQGIGRVVDPLQEAINRLARAGGHLNNYLGRPASNGCDVFVGFSVAGGTGAGLFYDFLHLVSVLAEQLSEGEEESVHIYPLVVLPSAFPAGGGGGRTAQLNGGPALRELFRLIDACNSGTVPNAPLKYPVESDTERFGKRIRNIQTAFLFDRPEAVTMDDLHRSIVAFMRALVGTENKADAGRAGGSFASNFINRATGRNQAAPDGIGLHPASTALAAQLTIPSDDIADILALRLVAQATEVLSSPRPQEDNHAAIRSFNAAAGLAPLEQRAATDPLPSLPADVDGATEIGNFLRQRAEAAVAQASARKRALKTEVAQLAERVNGDGGARDLLKKHDVFRVDRVIRGNSNLTDAVSREGVEGFARRRAEVVHPPERSGFQPSAPPTAPPLHDRLGGLVHLKQDDDSVKSAISAQSAWYEWRIRSEWHDAWSSYRGSWEPSLSALADRMKNIIDAFEKQASAEPTQFRSACTALYGERQGVVYFLPDGGPDRNLIQFYETALIPRLIDKFGLQAGDNAGAILNRIIDDEWEMVFEHGQKSAHAAIDFVLDKVGEEISAVLSSRVRDAKPLLPPLSVLLEQAVTGGDAPTDVDRVLVDRFRASLIALRPLGFEPPGTGPMKIEVFYPASARNSAIETFLREALHAQDAAFEQISDTNFLGVVMTREAVHATSVDEYRDLLRAWSGAIDTPRDEDALPWRQRLGFDSRWVALSDADRPRVLLPILNALWDGSIEIVEGTAADPERIRIHQAEAPDAPPLELTLRPYGDLSRWTNVLRAYERYAIQSGTGITLECEQLMKRGAPTGAADKPAPPSDAYREFRHMVEAQKRLADETMGRVADEAKAVARQARDFWHVEVPAALATEFPGGGGPSGRNHVELYKSFSDGDDAR